jgi:hypothetical protein
VPQGTVHAAVFSANRQWRGEPRPADGHRKLRLDGPQQLGKSPFRGL